MVVLQSQTSHKKQKSDWNVILDKIVMSESSTWSLLGPTTLLAAFLITEVIKHGPVHGTVACH